MGELNFTLDPLNPSACIDLLTRRIIQARAVLHSLLAAMENEDGSVTKEIACNAIWAASELLEV